MLHLFGWLICHWEATNDQAAILGTFATGPAIRKYPANLITEIIGTFVLVLGLLALQKTEFAAGTNIFAVAGLIIALGLSSEGQQAMRLIQPEIWASIGSCSLPIVRIKEPLTGNMHGYLSWDQ